MSKRKVFRKGKAIMEALTPKQAATLLDSIFDAVDAKTRDQMLAKLDQDTARTTRLILSGESVSQGAARSDGKVKSDWDDLWAQWYDIASEAGDEEGRYVEQDHDWEPPNFCGDEVASELDKVGEKMRSLLPKVSDARDVFVQGLVEVDKQVGELPDWMGAADVGYSFGPVATRCLLEWEYRHAQEAGEDMGTFFSRIAGVCDRLEAMPLDGEEIERFCLHLPKREREALFGHLKAEGVQPTGQSVWSELSHTLSEEFDHATYLRQCEARVDRSWAEGLPLLEQLVRDRDYRQAEALLKKMLAGCLRFVVQGDWVPETSLFACLGHYGHSDPATETLLGHWLRISTGLGQAQRTAALRIQIQVMKTPWHWDSVTQSFSRNAPGLTKDILGALFDHWVQYNSRVAIDPGLRDCWIGWLLETGVEPKKTKTWFQAQLCAWLDRLCSDTKALVQEQGLLTLLTRDLMYKSPEATRYPALYRMVSCRTVAGQNEKSRREWLGRMDAAKCMPRLMRCWSEGVESMVPDPRSGGGDYGEQVEWMVVVRELNKGACERVLRKWKVDHSRRRNLWTALATRGLSE